MHRYRTTNICVPLTAGSDRVNPGSLFPIAGCLWLMVSVGIEVGEKGKVLKRVLPLSVYAMVKGFVYFMTVST